MQEGFRSWLDQRRSPSGRGIGDVVSRVRRWEREFGDLDEYLDAQEFDAAVEICGQSLPRRGVLATLKRLYATALASGASSSSPRIGTLFMANGWDNTGRRGSRTWLRRAFGR